MSSHSSRGLDVLGWLVCIRKSTDSAHLGARHKVSTKRTVHLSNVRPFNIVTGALTSPVYEHMPGTCTGEQREVPTDGTYEAGDPGVFIGDVYKVIIARGLQTTLLEPS